MVNEQTVKQPNSENVPLLAARQFGDNLVFIDDPSGEKRHDRMSDILGLVAGHRNTEIMTDTIESLLQAFDIIRISNSAD